MNIQQQHGIISTITFAPYTENDEYRKLRDDLFRRVLLSSNSSPKKQIDVYDESILVFETFTQALTYLINVFRAAVELGKFSDINFSLRSSLCEGDYFMQQDQIYGDAVNLATRLSYTSRENELLVCGIDRQIIEEFVASQSDVNYFIRNPDENCASICLLDEDSTQSENDNKVFQVECDNKTSVFESSRNQKILIGRSNESDIYIDSDDISRNHATISLNYNNIFIEDHSSNGSYLYYEGREIFLTNDSMKISSTGFISCGRKVLPKKSSANIISYLFCEEATSAA